MSQNRNREKKTVAAKGPKKESLKKIPARKTAKTEAIRVSPTVRKNFSSLIELAKRKLTVSTPAPIPQNLKPMLATAVDEAFNDEGWQFEIKLDGYRTLAYLNKGSVDLKSRNNNSFNLKFSPIHEALLQWPVNAVVDGEIVVLNSEGRPDFGGIQQWDKRKSGTLVFYVFDLLWLDGMDLTSEPLNIRQEVLREIIPDDGVIRYSDHIDAVGIDFFNIAKDNNLEGIIAKKKNAPYIPDSRSKTWLKIKAEQRHEAIICGYTRKKDTDRLFSSLILGRFEEKTLKYIGAVGTGFTQALQAELIKKMKPHVTRNAPFDPAPKLADDVVWLKPFLVCEVKYTELTSEGVMRHPSFQGLREDKAAFELNPDIPENVEALINQFSDNDVLLNPKETSKVVNIDSHDLKLTNLDKVFWPKERITKGDLINYYYEVSPYMMPYMLDRPQSLNRFPNGIEGSSFYHKNMNGKVESWVKTFERVSESTGEPKDFLICNSTASLIYMANLGCIEMNPWHSRSANPHHPDWCVVDLDPGKISFEKVIETAQVVHGILNDLQIPSFPKTSGSTGIHIYIPLGGKYNYEQSRQLAELISHLAHEELPKTTSLIRNPRKREDKIYLDYLQNRPIQTICAPYSVRPKPGATVSMPLHWDEVKKGLKISNFNMRNAIARVRSEGDLFKGVLGKGIDLNRTLKSLSQLIG